MNKTQTPLEQAPTQAGTSGRQRPRATAVDRTVVALLIIIIGIVSLLPALGELTQGGGSAPAQPSVRYATENGDGTQEGTVDSTLRIVARFPSGSASADDVLSSVLVELVDERGTPAQFGALAPGSLEMKPGGDVTEWTYEGSVPSRPGLYHPVFTLKRLFAGAAPERVELPSASLRATVGVAGPVTGGYAYNDEADLWIVSPDASRRRRLTFFGLAGRGEYAVGPAWSPNGRQIAFTYLPDTPADQAPATDIWVVEPEGTGMKQLVARGRGESLSTPYWSQDGRYLYFTVEQILPESTGGMPTPGPGASAWRIDRLDLASGARAVWAMGALTPSTGGPGEDVVYLREAAGAGPAGTYSLVRAGANGEGQSVLFSDIRAKTIVSPRLSPDGKWLVYSAVVVEGPSSFDFFQWLFFQPRVAQAHGLLWDLYMVPATGAAGGRPIRLTTLGEDTPYAVWLDNSTIAMLGVKGLFNIKIAGDGSPLGPPVQIGNVTGSGISGSRHSVLTWYGP